MSYSIGYITFKNSSEAHQICRALVESRLVACANILPEHHAIYHWKEDVEVNVETAAIIKTQKKHEKQIVSFIRKMHSYSTPCVIFVPLHTPFKEFTQWIKTETEVTKTKKRTSKAKKK
ncbi:MAG: divalent-cation tolerance protein CutA [Bdellovibrionaceae bacterium]|nr:divalent-cation tolerance protein CutA [Pseudobdellovibrionaceae bacterium]